MGGMDSSMSGMYNMMMSPNAMSMGPYGGAQPFSPYGYNGFGGSNGW
jgi:hypothetical protein